LENENIRYNKMISKSAFFSNVIFLICHLCYLLMFLINKVWIMAYINIASASVYVLLFLAIKYKKYAIFAIVCGIEITAFMAVSTIVCGYDCGFHLCLIGLCILVFYTGYFSKSRTKIVRPLPISFAFMVIYLFLYFYCKNVKPVVEIEENFQTVLYVIHVLIVFLFVISFLFILITYILRLEAGIRKESKTDKLTGIANRNALSDYYERLGNQKSNYLIAIFDIDDFKKFNDINGHLCGDYVLKEIARIATENSLDDFVSRWGGEEFVVISKIDDTLENTYNKIDKIRITIKDYNFSYNGKKLHSTITIGVASYVDGDTLDMWIKKADEKLYFGKKNGKNQIVHQ